MRYDRHGRIAARTATAAVCVIAFASSARCAQAPSAVDTRSEHSASAASTASDGASTSVPRTLGADEARSSVQRSVQYLLRTQRADGSWGSGALESVWEYSFSPETFYGLKVAGVALASMALLASDDTPERRVALERALDWLVTSREPKRGNDWDIDSAWAWLYGFQALVAAAADERFADMEWQTKLRERGLWHYRMLDEHQEPLGGWGYYEGEVISRRPTWSTSFATACVIPALLEARDLGWPIDDVLVARAVTYVDRCRLPNGAYTYDLSAVPSINGGEHINQVKGSLGRIQVCNWALARAGVRRVTPESIAAGLDLFLREHRFLDAARLKPIPHEAYYANASYFYFFGHCYAGYAINELPEAQREEYHARLRPHLVKAQWKDGESKDTIGCEYFSVAGTSFSILALEAGLHPERMPFARARKATR